MKREKNSEYKSLRLLQHDQHIEKIGEDLNPDPFCVTVRLRMISRTRHQLWSPKLLASSPKTLI
jgi:hypothetical protein